MSVQLHNSLIKDGVLTTSKFAALSADWDFGSGYNLKNSKAPTDPAHLVNLAFVNSFLAANNAMVFKGSVGAGGTLEISAFNAITTYNVGWTYRCITAGTIQGNVCEIGDLITAIVTRAGSGALTSDWTVSQTNIDGAVVGPASVTDSYVALFSGTTGKLLKAGSGALGTAAYVNTTSFEATGNVASGIATHAALITGVHGLLFTSGKSLTLQKSITLTSVDDTSVITLPSGTHTLIAVDDSRITNAGTAYGWGNHASAGYAVVKTCSGCHSVNNTLGSIDIDSGTGTVYIMTAPTSTWVTLIQDTDYRLTNSRVASDVSAWAKAGTKPSYNFSEIGSKPTTISGYGISDGATLTDAQTLTNKTLTDVKINRILSNSDGAPILEFGDDSVSCFNMDCSTSTNLAFSAGSSTIPNISISLLPKGTGCVYVGSNKIVADGRIKGCAISSTNSGLGNGLTLIFTFPDNFVSGSETIFWDGVAQPVGSGLTYTVTAANAITFTAGNAPESGVLVWARYTIA